MVTMAIPEFPGEVIIEPTARTALDAFFAKHNLPAGSQLPVWRQRIEGKLGSPELATPLAKAPDTRNLFLVRLPNPPGSADMPTRNAFVDTRKNEFYLSISGGFIPSLPVRWYGPAQLDDIVAQQTAAPAGG